MLSLKDTICLLGYSDSKNFRTAEDDFELENKYIFHCLKAACTKSGTEFHGLLMFDIALEKLDCKHVPKTVLCVASAVSVDSARELHKLIWNLGNIPFLLVRLPDQIRLYNGFNFSKIDQPLESLLSPAKSELLSQFGGIACDEITSGNVWQSVFAAQLDPKTRIDHKLLTNLDTLSGCLRKTVHPLLEPHDAHALIGKFLYLRYLHDRGILSDQWLQSNQISFDDALGHSASLGEFRKLVKCLEERFNGKIFELDLSGGSIKDKHIELVASVFNGNEIKGNYENGVVQQLAFDFTDYDFEYIPVETLSIVYQQFLHEEDRGRSKGAYYTPETLAEYVLSEMESIVPLRSGMTVMDPSS